MNFFRKLTNLFTKLDVKTADQWGRTVLHDVCASGQVKLVRKYIELGADVNAIDSSLGEVTPLLIAAMNNNLELVELLVNAGADVNFMSKKILTGGRTALIEAVNNGSVNMVDLLINNGSDIELRGFNCKSALMTAAENNELEIAQILIIAGADMEQNAYNHTAICFAAKMNHLDMVKLLLKHNAKIKPLKKMERNKIHPRIVKWLKQDRIL